MINTTVAPPASTGLPTVALDISINPVAQTIIAQTSAGAVTTDITASRTNQWAGAPPVHTTGLYNFSLAPPGLLTKPPALATAPFDC